MKAAFDAEDIERREKEMADKEREAQKASEALVRSGPKSLKISFWMYYVGKTRMPL